MLARMSEVWRISSPMSARECWVASVETVVRLLQQQSEDISAPALQFINTILSSSGSAGI
jgi:hypothetical protein